MKTISEILNFRLLALLFTALVVTTSCSSDDDNGNDDDGGVVAPGEEEEVEVITDLTLVFTPVELDGGPALSFSAQDPDGEGVQELMVLDAITLAADTEYTLTFEIENGLDADDIEDIGEEILEENAEHQFFFAFTEDIFTNPMGDGNIDTASDAINYEDFDVNGLNVGLETIWTTGAASTGTFTVKLQHQPDIKSATTGADDGDSDIDIEFTLNIVE